MEIGKGGGGRNTLPGEVTRGDERLGRGEAKVEFGEHGTMTEQPGRRVSKVRRRRRGSERCDAVVEHGGFEIVDIDVVPMAKDHVGRSDHNVAKRVRVRGQTGP